MTSSLTSPKGAPSLTRSSHEMLDRESPKVDSAGPIVAVLAADDLGRRRIETALVAGGVVPSASTATESSLQSSDSPDVLVVLATRSTTYRRALLAKLRRRLQETKFVVVSPQDSRAAVRSTIDAGADGVVFETDIEQSLVPTLLAVAAGQVAVPASRRETMVRPTLSRREKQILGLVVLGLSNREIASRLFLAQSTMKCHLSAAFIKLGVRSRHEAVSAHPRS